MTCTPQTLWSWPNMRELSMHLTIVMQKGGHHWCSLQWKVRSNVWSAFVRKKNLTHKVHNACGSLTTIFTIHVRRKTQSKHVSLNMTHVCDHLNSAVFHSMYHKFSSGAIVKVLCSRVLVCNQCNLLRFVTLPVRPPTLTVSCSKLWRKHFLRCKTSASWSRFSRLRQSWQSSCWSWALEDPAANHSNPFKFFPCPRADHLSIFERLLERGANIRLQDKQGKNALYIAVEHSRQRCVTALLQQKGEGQFVQTAKLCQSCCVISAWTKMRFWWTFWWPRLVLVSTNRKRCVQNEPVHVK